VKLHHLRPAPGSNKPPTRKGRGEAAGKGKTAGRGTKGSRARGTIRPGFEGGQMPLQRRLPKLGGFKNPNRVEYTVVNVERLAAALPRGGAIDPEGMVAAGLVRKHQPVKVLGRGDVRVPLQVRAHAFSASAAEKITSAGGTVEVI